MKYFVGVELNRGSGCESSLAFHFDTKDCMPHRISIKYIS